MNRERWGFQWHMMAARWAIALLVVASIAGAVPASASAPSGNPFAARSAAHDDKPDAHTVTVPTWSSAFTNQGTAYPYQMVGTDPAAGSRTTVVPVQIVPLRFVFADGVVLDGDTNVREIEASPLFEEASFKSGTTQYGDAMQRANFWHAVTTTSPDWHIRLAPRELPTQTITVPSAEGREFTGKTAGERIGLVHDAWLTPQLETMLTASHADPRGLILFLTDNTSTYYTAAVEGVDLCCQPGYHNTYATTDARGMHLLYTYIFGAYIAPGTFVGANDDAGAVFTSTLRDINIISHEVVEWLNDPFLTNAVPPWQMPSGDAAFYGCTNLLEVGDPLVGSSFPVTMHGGRTYSLPDAAFLAWFARTATSDALGGAYSYLGIFTTFSPSC